MPDIYLGAVRTQIRVSGARSLKDRRQVVQSLCDKARKRLFMSATMVDAQSPPSQATLVFTACSDDAHALRTMLEKVGAMVRTAPGAEVVSLDTRIDSWQTSGDDWAKRMMAELAYKEDEHG